jgi:hypothetical protein
MSKLQKEVTEILESVRSGTIEITKVASTEALSIETNPVSGGLRKLAEAVRVVDTSPTYDDIFFLVGRNK